MPFTRPPAEDDPDWGRASDWLASHHPDPQLRVVGVPCSVGSITPSQAARTPGYVREALRRFSTWDVEGSVDVASLPVHDAGDWEDIANLHLDEAIVAIGAHAAALKADVPTVFLGGDNAITRPLVTGLLGPDLDRVGVITFDAHHDVRSLRSGPRNGTPIRGLVEEEGLPGENVVQIGIAAFANSPTHARWAADAGIHAVSRETVEWNGIDAALDQAFDRLDHCRAIYVDVDVDVLDATYAPACPGARPGGMRPADLLRAVRGCGAEPRVAAADLVEVDAAADVDGRTLLVTAQLLLAFASGVASRGVTGE